MSGAFVGHLLANLNNYAFGLMGVMLLLFLIVMLGPVVPAAYATNPLWAPFKRIADYILEPDRSNKIARRFLYVTLALEAVFIFVYEALHRL